jgi:uncharacterized protein (TIGR00106 family)
VSLIAELSIFPVGRGESLSPYVARAVAVIQASGLAYQLNPMGTCIEGEWREVMDVVERCLTELKKDCSRISLNLKVDWRAGREEGLASKTLAVESRLKG